MVFCIIFVRINNTKPNINAKYTNISNISLAVITQSIFLLFVKVNLSTSGDGFQACNGFHNCSLVSLLSDCYLNIETPGKDETKDGLRKMFPFEGKMYY